MLSSVNYHTLSDVTSHLAALLLLGNLLYTVSVMSRCCTQALGAAHTNCVK